MSIDFGKSVDFDFSKAQKLNFYRADDPLEDVEYTGDLAKDAEQELDAMQAAYRERAKAEEQRFKDATDTEYWFAVCFRSRSEKEAFLQQFNLTDIGDKYLDGDRVTQRLNERG